MLEAAKLSRALAEKYGIPLVVEATADDDGERIRLEPRDIERTQGFRVEVVIGWKSLQVAFVPGPFAKPLLSTMAEASEGQRVLFRTFVEAAVQAGAEVEMWINSDAVSTFDIDSWPTTWGSLRLTFYKGPIAIDHDDAASIDSLTQEWSGRMLGSVFALMTLEPIESEPRGEAEGGGYEVRVKGYERSQLNRAACIEVHGVRCKACGFDFQEHYGEIGTGFIEVHHVESVASLAPGTVLDPSKDLVPLCSNCHSMAHRRKIQPFTVEELREMIDARREARDH